MRPWLRRPSRGRYSEPAPLPKAENAAELKLGPFSRLTRFLTSGRPNRSRSSSLTVPGSKSPYRLSLSSMEGDSTRTTRTRQDSGTSTEASSAEDVEALLRRLESGSQQLQATIGVITSPRGSLRQLAAQQASPRDTGSPTIGSQTPIDATPRHGPHPQPHQLKPGERFSREALTYHRPSRACAMADDAAFAWRARYQASSSAPSRACAR